MNFDELLDYAGSIVGPREAEAGVKSEIMKLLKTPISRRTFLKKGAKEALSEHKFPGTSSKKGVDEIIVSLGEKAGIDNAAETSNFWPLDRGIDYVSPGLTKLDRYKNYLTEEFPWLTKQDKSRIVALSQRANTRWDQGIRDDSLSNVYKYFTYKTAERLNPSKKDILQGIRRFSAGTSYQKEDYPALKKGLEAYDINWDKLGRLQLPKKTIQQLEDIADSFYEAGVKQAGKVAGKVGEVELSRRQFLGLGAKSKVKSLLDALKATEKKEK